MAIKKAKRTKDISVESYSHKGKKRKNNPPVGLVSSATDRLNGRTKYQHDPHIDPYLSWAGKKEGTEFEVQNVSLHIHERIDPKRIIKSFLKDEGKPRQPSLFEEPDNDPPLNKAIDFYRHEQDWSNRLIAGDSLLVMNSLLKKEGMAGKVQMVYFDPPYGIKYNSNFQPFVNKRDVKDNNDADIPAEPEMIQAFRDTWELGIHSYLTYLRERLLLAKDLLHESGSCFVQISDENVHHVREIMDEVFLRSNFCGMITFQKSGGSTSAKIEQMTDYLLWYAKNIDKVKTLNLLTTKEESKNFDRDYCWIDSPNGMEHHKMTQEEINDSSKIPIGWRRFRLVPCNSQHYSKTRTIDYTFQGKTFYPGSDRQWSIDPKLLDIVAAKNRLVAVGNSLMCTNCMLKKHRAIKFVMFGWIQPWRD